MHAFADDTLTLGNDDIVVGASKNALERRLVWREVSAGAFACCAHGIIGQKRNNLGQISRIGDAGDIGIGCAHG